MVDEAYRVYPRVWSRDLPASGAFKSGDDVGTRQICEITEKYPFVFDDRSSLEKVEIAYETWGELNSDRSNAILVCHALTGDSHAGGRRDRHNPAGGWWKGLIGPGKTIDTNRFYVVCSNVLGGCQGSTGPASINPLTGRHYGSSFPTVTIRDMVRAQSKLATRLGIDVWHCVIGGSMGGMQALEWALMYPERLRGVAALAVGVAASPWQIAWSAVGRLALTLDPKWQNGNYYESGNGEGPHAGFAVARSVAQITYRTDELYQQRFGRELVDPHNYLGPWDRFQVEGYLDYQGEKLVRRFDANSYLRLNRAMDLHDVERGRQSLKRAFSALRVPLATLSISSDVLYPPRQQQELAQWAETSGVPVIYDVVQSEHGHDGFLLEFDAVGKTISKLFDEIV